MTLVALSLGSNMGNRLDNLRRAVALMKPLGNITGRSAVYETPPWGMETQPRFLNACVLIETGEPPKMLLDKLKEIERTVGRVPRERWGPREIDIDILIYGDEVINEIELKIPHPLMRERNFVLVPLSEIAPDMKIPPDGRQVSGVARKFFGNREKTNDDEIIKITQL